MKTTPEQFAFFREAEHGTRDIILESVAGSGKTTSIVKCLDYIDDLESILCCSFTKLAAQQLERKIKGAGFTNVTSSTLNSVGWQVCRQNVRGAELDAHKTLNILQALLERSNLVDGLGSPLDSKKVYASLVGPVKRLVGLLKAYVVDPKKEVITQRAIELADYHGVDIPEGSTREASYAREQVYHWVDTVYRRGIEVHQYMDFDDQKFFPVYFKWGMPKYHKIVIDECQDCNVCDIELVKLLKSANPKARTFWVGDRMQAIYLFRGSLLNAMDAIREDFNCTYMTLSVCFRCADDILLEPKEINPLIKGPDPNPKGKGIVKDVSTPQFIESAAVGDYVICRTTAPLVKRCLQLVRKGTPAKVKGREVGRSLLNLIEKINSRIGNPAPALTEFIETLSVYKVETVAILEAAKRDEAATRVQDECEALTHFCMEARSLDEVARKIDTLFTDNDDDTSVVLLLTGHKSKGLEADRVWFLRPDLCPFPKAKSDHEKEAERRLRYVILTRAALERYHVLPEPEEVKPTKTAY
jgi:DNA helicase-2/ATP-dependent DNA helicase PcrA